MARTAEQQRQYMRDYRANKARREAAATGASVTNIAAPRGRAARTPAAAAPPRKPKADAAAHEFESVETSVRTEIEAMPHGASHPGKVAIMLRLARILDNTAAVPQHAPAAKALDEMMMKLRGREVSGGDKLGQLRSRRTNEGKSA